MNARVRNILETADRVLLFCRDNPVQDPSYAAALLQFGEQVAATKAKHLSQLDATQSQHSGIGRRDGIRRRLQQTLLPHLISVGVALSRERKDLVGRFKLPDINSNDQFFERDLGVLLSFTDEHREALLQAGLSAQVFDEIREQQRAFAEARDAVRAARLGHIGARAGLDDAARKLMILMDVLDGIYRWHFADDPVRLSAWQAAKRIHPQTRKRPAPEDQASPDNRPMT